MRDPSDLEKISRLRKRLKNPYAYIEHLELEVPGGGNEVYVNASESAIIRDRVRLQNPYAHDKGRERFSALPANPRSGNTTAPLHESSLDSRRRRHTDDEIESLVRNLHRRIWHERENLWPEGPPADPVDMLDPSVAASLLGFQFEYGDVIGETRQAGHDLDVAGLIDQSSKVIRVSPQHSRSVLKFTGAHEIGHAVLHPSMGSVHRDRPVDGSVSGRNKTELEADRFAVNFLMPEKLVKERFRAIFGVECFYLNEDTAFALGGFALSELHSKCPRRRDLAKLIARSGRYNGRQVRSLSDQFGVSVTAMAIRLEELDLVKDPGG